MNYSIKPVENEESAFLWEMLYQSLYVPKGEPAFSQGILKEPAIEKYLKNWGNPDDHALIAKGEQNNPLGAVWIRVFNSTNPGYGYIDDETPELGMAIATEFRGQGIGTHLLSEMVALAQTKGYPALSLSVNPHNKLALQLYEKAGFEKVYEDDGGSWTMKRDL